MKFWICPRHIAGILVALALLPAAGAGAADVKEGMVITKANVDEVADLLSPGPVWCVKHGMKITVGPYRRIEWNKAYKEATEKYSGQVKLAPDGRSIVGHVAGLPFPNVDLNDPQAALKLMFNYEYKPFVTDDMDLRDFDADSGPIRSEGPMRVERHYILQHVRALFYTGRLYVDPKPELPNPDGVRAKFSFHPMVEPFDIKGIGMTSVRYLSPDRQDDTWLYLPQMRRVRRLSSAQRSDSMFGQDTDIDSYGGYNGQIPWFKWKYLGEKTLLGAFHAKHMPVKWCEPPGDFAFCDEWEKRQMYVIEGTPTHSQYAFSKRVIFLDKETFLIAWSDIYDKGGRLYKVWLNDFSFRKSFGEGATEYPDEMPFEPSTAMVDVQESHATHAALPSQKRPNSEAWRFNQGNKTGVTEEFFSISHLISSGQ